MTRTAVAILLTIAVAVEADAQTWTEVGDAGELIGTAQAPISAFGFITLINGTLSGGTSNPDLYLITLLNPAAFSATTVGLSAVDTQLFLFTSSGVGIASSDNVSPMQLQSTLPLGQSLYASLPGGLYILGISSADSDPSSSAGLIFPASSQGVVGPIGPGGESPLSGWSLSTMTGSYGIALTGVGVPAPPGLGLIALAALAGRRRRRA